jgi:long-chain fatty acid transport protein
MSLFPHTSIKENQFFGIKMEGCEAYSAAFRVGFQYKYGDLTVGGAYLSATDHQFDNGNSKINYTAIGQGIERYDSELEGFNWPQQIGLGLSYHITPKLRIALDIDWINWSDAINTITFKLAQGNNPGIPEHIIMSYPMHWNNQLVYAFGLEYDISSIWSIRAGYNYAKNPVPAQHLLPYFPAIAEHHITGGFSYAAQKWSIDFACEWALENSEFSNNSLYCSHGFSEEMSQVTTHFMLNYRI